MVLDGRTSSIPLRVVADFCTLKLVMHKASSRHWKNHSVIMFASGDDPVAKILQEASRAALKAMEHGWSGPPFDPFLLAELMHIAVVPNSQVLDARTVPLKGDRLQIEYNPDRPRARTRYSVAHEIAHTFFPDCAERVRNRTAPQNCGRKEWELEMLCNIGAAELLMPTGSLADTTSQSLSIQDVIDLRKKFEVSTESILLRLIRITNQPCAMFVASRGQVVQARYRVDYSTASRTSSNRLPSNTVLPTDSVVSTCTAIGHRAEADETWPEIGRVHLECIGVSPYPGSVHPRVIGLLTPLDAKACHTGSMQFVTGDATEPRGEGALILAHVVNDATPNWGAGFGKVVQRKWPGVQSRFRESWLNSSRKHLGEIFLSDADPRLTICQLICQHGYGYAIRPRIRYSALRDCLTALCEEALRQNASIHMPRIGTGEAGGSWALVSALIDEILCAAGLSVTVYDLPQTGRSLSIQPGLFDRKI